MRPTFVARSDMPGPPNYNLWWGDKTGGQRQKGIVQYSVSPFRLRAFKHLLSGYLFNGYRRIAAQAPYFVIPFAAGYGIYAWARKYDEWQRSKDGHIHAMEHGEGGH
ncbi:hypothetical protein PUNSTDRAFT_80939 [Punctularia strigosozonata HHB-11173 SS5]|uniref:uncharacterized protein n=1 Tax=Punctularia strigosozonata (strain HHB-11173) TaxID=741275 RepID=UPI00044184BF|nr:uncharacterized protein PUNSTDRAFT_80939 [Punctularia strigosozonata HHB-11173 SS5]EIN14510.1 hypothetical protein PUNSTDRAFT_80939 [Punctularia strigosozonata HHB-11173 SS5]